MSVSGVSSSDNSYWQSMQTTNNQRRQDVKALGDALKNGDLSAAQSAFDNLKSLGGPQPPQAAASQSSSQGSGTNPLQSLASALQSGDLSGAQAAFAAMEKNHGMHRHHHHGGPGSAPPSGGDTTQPAPDSTSGGDPTTGNGSTLNVTG